MESILRDIVTLSPGDRQAVEALFGHSVGQNGQVCLLLLDELTDEQRRRWESLISAVSPFHRNVAATGASQVELENEIDQAIADVRSGKH